MFSTQFLSLKYNTNNSEYNCDHYNIIQSSSSNANLLPVPEYMFAIALRSSQMVIDVDDLFLHAVEKKNLSKKSTQSTQDLVQRNYEWHNFVGTRKA